MGNISRIEAGSNASCRLEMEGAMRGFVAEKWPELLVFAGFLFTWAAIVVHSL